MNSLKSLFHAGIIGGLTLVSTPSYSQTREIPLSVGSETCKRYEVMDVGDFNGFYSEGRRDFNCVRVEVDQTSPFLPHFAYRYLEGKGFKISSKDGQKILIDKITFQGNFQGADFTGVQFRDSVFIGNYSGATFVDIESSGSSFAADLTGANFTGAKLNSGTIVSNHLGGGIIRGNFTNLLITGNSEVRVGDGSQFGSVKVCDSKVFGDRVVLEQFLTTGGKEKEVCGPITFTCVTGSTEVEITGGSIDSVIRNREQTNNVLRRCP